MPAFSPAPRARVVAALVRRFGVKPIRQVLSAMKVRGMSAYSSAHPGGHEMPVTLEEVGKSHRGVGGNLRAAVFGANDGLISNASLIMGIAGATSDTRMILLTGVAGLLAGALSMAAGEFISVRSQRELYEHQILLEQDELDEYPAEEAEELALIYAARGMDLDEARRVSQKMLADPTHALDVLAREELGLNPDNLGSAWGAAAFSFACFARGRIGAAVAVPVGCWRTSWRQASSPAFRCSASAPRSVCSRAAARVAQRHSYARDRRGRRRPDVRARLPARRRHRLTDPPPNEIVGYGGTSAGG